MCFGLSAGPDQSGGWAFESRNDCTTMDRRKIQSYGGKMTEDEKGDRKEKCSGHLGKIKRDTVTEDERRMTRKTKQRTDPRLWIDAF